jgi:hypothetical protein
VLLAGGAPHLHVVPQAVAAPPLGGAGGALPLLGGAVDPHLPLAPVGLVLVLGRCVYAREQSSGWVCGVMARVYLQCGEATKKKAAVRRNVLLSINSFTQNEPF